jgi:hypothetical protein
VKGTRGVNRLPWIALLLGSVLLLAGCALFAGPAVVTRFPVDPVRMPLGQGVDMPEATRRLAAALPDLLVAPAEPGAGRLAFKNRRAYELRLVLDVDKHQAQLALARVGHETAETGVDYDLQLVDDFRSTVRRARALLLAPSAPSEAAGSSPAAGPGSDADAGAPPGDPAAAPDAGALGADGSRP